MSRDSKPLLGSAVEMPDFSRSGAFGARENDSPCLLWTGAHRGWLAWQFETLPRIGQPAAADTQHRQVGVHKVAYVEDTAIGAEGGCLGQATNCDFPDRGHTLALDA